MTLNGRNNMLVSQELSVTVVRYIQGVWLKNTAGLMVVRKVKVPQEIPQPDVF